MQKVSILFWLLWCSLCWAEILQINLRTLYCYKTTELGHDEIFFIVAGKHGNGNTFSYVVPQSTISGDADNNQAWDMNDSGNLQNRELNHVIYKYSLDEGETADITIVAMESDNINYSSLLDFITKQPSTDLVKKIMDKFNLRNENESLGAFHITAKNKEGKFIWEHTFTIDNPNRKSYIFADGFFGHLRNRNDIKPGIGTAPGDIDGDYDCYMNIWLKPDSTNLNTTIPKPNDSSTNPQVTNPIIHLKDLRYDSIYRKACHNCYDRQYSSTLKSALDMVTGIELDFYNSHQAGYWYVRHHPLGENNNNSANNGGLDQCLADVKSWSDTHPSHGVITVFLDKKDNWNDAHRPTDLDNLVLQYFPSHKIFKPSDLKGKFETLKIAAQKKAWPIMKDLEGKVIFVLTGGDLINLDHTNKTLHEYVQQRTEQAVIFTAPDVIGHEEIMEKPKEFDNNTANWVVFYNLNMEKSHLGNLTKSLGYISRVWSSQQADEADNKYGQLVSDKINFIALFKFQETSFLNGQMEGSLEN